MMALIMLAEDDPAGTYLLEETEGLLLLLRLSEGEPAEEALVPLPLYPSLLPLER